ncbi:hypothetical protein I3760_10G070600 [Carya illinoinensis]|nr:hypothetical protein I3760_10G070600 [Carya illinoinensis]
MIVVRGIVPDSITYTTLFTHSRTNCSPEEAIELHDEMFDWQTFKALLPTFSQRQCRDLSLHEKVSSKNAKFCVAILSQCDYFIVLIILFSSNFSFCLGIPRQFNGEYAELRIQLADDW